MTDSASAEFTAHADATGYPVEEMPTFEDVDVHQSRLDFNASSNLLRGSIALTFLP